MNYQKAREILEFEKNEKIELNLLKRKYRMLALLYHPDKNPAEDANECFTEIKEAYDYLLKNIDNSNTEYVLNEEYSYKDILIKFLRSISENDGDTIINNIIYKITQKCEEKSLELLSKLNKDLFIRIYDILYKYNRCFRISDDFMIKIQNILEDKIKNDECIILNPTLEDLFAKNIYKLSVREHVLLIPLWHHELVYEIDGSDIYVKCIPILPDEYQIDSDNNIIIEMHYNISELLDMEEICVKIEENQYAIPIDELRITRRQKLLLSGVGIPRIVSNDIYDVTKSADILLDVYIT